MAAARGRSEKLAPTASKQSSVLIGHTMKTKRDSIREWNLLGDAETPAKENLRGNRA
jgi:hypothetical protein